MKEVFILGTGLVAGAYIRYLLGQPDFLSPWLAIPLGKAHDSTSTTLGNVCREAVRQSDLEVL